MPTNTKIDDIYRNFDSNDLNNLNNALAFG